MIQLANNDLVQLWVQTLGLMGHEVPNNILGQDIYPKLLGRMISIEAHHSSSLDQIPSETTKHERRFIYNYFQKIWKGETSVLEIGPFMGGTTRCIAMGMLSNPCRRDSVKLFTYDKFCGYYTREALVKYLQPLVRQNVLQAEDIEFQLQEDAHFKFLFDKIHKNSLYGDFIESFEGALPDTVKELDTTQKVFTPPSGESFEIVFVDGCKSWYGTKYFMSKICSHLSPGSHLIFQDYGWRSCFWLPVFLNVFRPYFRLVAYTDATYSFQLVQGLSSQIIHNMFPDSPELFGLERIREVFSVLTSEAQTLSDGNALLNLQLQLGAALAYLGEHEEARTLFDNMISMPMFRNHVSVIKAAKRCPGYRPDGPIYLSRN